MDSLTRATQPRDLSGYALKDRPASTVMPQAPLPGAPQRRAPVSHGITTTANSRVASSQNQADYAAKRNLNKQTQAATTLLKTNGVNNLIQSQLNLIAGSNTALSNVGGNVTISSGTSFPFVPPTIGQFDFSGNESFNIGDPPVVVTNESFGFLSTGPQFSRMLGIRTSAITPPWAIQTVVAAPMLNLGANFQGMILMDGPIGTATHAIQFGIASGSGFVLSIDYLTVSGTTLGFSSNAISVLYAALGGTYLMLRVRDDGTNRFYDVSTDLQNWLNVLETTRTTFAVVNRGGFYTFASTTNFLLSSALHYLES